MAWIVKPSATMQIDRRDEPYLTDVLRVRFEKKILPRYERKQGALLPILHEVQHKYGYLPHQALQEIAEFLDLAPAEVLDTVTFYEEFHLEPKGDYIVAVCRSIACEARDHVTIVETIQEALGIEPGETTADGKFSLVEVECLGSCGTAPVALINEDLHENLTAESIREILTSLPEIERSPDGVNGQLEGREGT